MEERTIHSVEFYGKHYSFFNRAFFDNKLGYYPIVLNKSKNVGGYVSATYVANRQGEVLSVRINEIGFSIYTKTTDDEAKGILLHEMIHVALNEEKIIKDAGGMHGAHFMAKLREIQEKTTIKIPLTDSPSERELNEDVKIKPAIFYLKKPQSGRSVYVAFTEKVLPDVLALAKKYEVYRDEEVYVVRTTHKQAAHSKIKRTVPPYGLEASFIPDDIYKEVVDTGEVLYSKEMQPATLHESYNREFSRIYRDYQKSRLSETTTPDSAEFKRWFGKSVVTVDGKAGSEPLVVYHGTDATFDAFEPKAGRKSGKGTQQLDFGIHLSEDMEYTKGYSKKGNSLALFLKLENPLDLTKAVWYRDEEGFDGIVSLQKALKIKPSGNEFYTRDGKEKLAEQQSACITQFMLDAINPAKVKQALIDCGYDGIVYEPYNKVGIHHLKRHPRSFIALFPENIKSVDNKGTWNPTDRRFRERHGSSPATGFLQALGATKSEDYPNEYRIERKYLSGSAYVTFDVNGNNEVEIAVLEAHPTNQGNGSKVLDEIVTYADLHGVHLTLEPWFDEEDESGPNLVKYYRKFGFQGDSTRMTREAFPLDMVKEFSRVYRESQNSGIKLVQAPDREGDGRDTYLCKRGNQLIGYFELLKNDVLSEVPEINIEVLPEFQGKGLSKEIYRAAMQKFKGKTLYAVVGENNKVSLSLHNRLFGEPSDFVDGFAVYTVAC